MRCASLDPVQTEQAEERRVNELAGYERPRTRSRTRSEREVRRVRMRVEAIQGGGGRRRRVNGRCKPSLRIESRGIGAPVISVWDIV
jgi:hypothetical protein